MQDKAGPPQTLWTKSRGPIKAKPYILGLAQAINQLLLTPIGVLPDTEEGIVRPFEIGIGYQIKERLKPDAALADLETAVRRYARISAYSFAMVQPDAMRHNIEGQPVEPVSERDRMDAMKRFLAIRDRMDKRRQLEAA